MNVQNLQDSFKNSFDNLENLVETSYDLIGDNPQKREQVLTLWKQNIVEFKRFVQVSSRQHQDKDIFKTITKSLMFGK